MPEGKYDALDIARHILWLRQGDVTTPLRLQKLIYFCHGWVLGYFDTPLIHQPEMAWEYGPVVERVYDEFKELRASPITGEAERLAELDPQIERFVGRVERAYRSYTPWDLVKITHEPGSPWYRTVQQFGFGHEIDNSLIRDYFAQRRR